MKTPLSSTAQLRTRSVRLLWILPVLALIVHIAFVAAVPSAEQRTYPDYERTYKGVALNLLHGNGLLHPDGYFSVGVPPGLPLLLAAAYWAGGAVGLDTMGSAAALTALTVILNCVLLVALGVHLLPPAPAWLPAIVWMAYPPGLWITKAPHPENPFITLLLLAVLLFVRLSSVSDERSKTVLLLALGCGLAAGAAMLIRAIGLPIPFLLAASLLLLRFRAWGRRALAVAAALLVGSAVVVLPWELIAYRQLGEIIPLASSGSDGIEEALRRNFEPSHAGHSLAVPDDVRELSRRVIESTAFDEYGAVIVDRETLPLAKALLHEARRDPLAAFKLFAIKVARSLYGTSTQEPRRERLLLLIQLPFLLLGLVGTGVALRQGGVRRDYAVVLLALASGFLALSVIAHPLMRYMLPVMALSTVAVALPIGLIGSAALSRLAGRRT
jgi:hypothetical protein